ncbi:DoxX family protein [Dermacoccaceae bacterium W4C1]
MLIRRLARPLLASYFIADGVQNLRNPAEAAEDAAPFVETLAKQTGAPNDPELAVRAVGGAKVLGGVLLATGRAPRPAAGILVLTQVVNTYVHEAFWAESDPDLKARKKTAFLRNVSILGGVLLATVDTAGKPSLRWRAVRSAEEGGRSARRAAKAAKLEAKLLTAQAKSGSPLS